jgi:hypothetical protein
MINLRPPGGIPQEKKSRTPIGCGFVGPRDGLDAVEKRKILIFAGNRTPAVQLLAHRYTD